MKQHTLHTLMALMGGTALACSCSTQYSVQGSTTLSQLEGMVMQLRAFHDEGLRSIDSTEVVHGHFVFHGNLDSTVMVNVVVNGQNMMPMVLEMGDISVSIDDKMWVTGTPLNDSLYQFIQRKDQLERELDALPSRFAQMIMSGVSEAEARRTLEPLQTRLTYDLDRLVTNFIVRNSNNVVGPGVFRIMTDAFPHPQFTPQIEEIILRSDPFFSSDPYVKWFLKQANRNMQTLQKQMER